MKSHFPPLCSLMEGSVRILPEEVLPARPFDLIACPAHIYAGCLATQLMARSPECTLHTMIQLDQCRKRLQVGAGVLGEIRTCDTYLFAY